MLTAALRSGGKAVYRRIRKHALPLALLGGLTATAMPALAQRNDLPFDRAYCGLPASLQPDPRARERREDPATAATVDSDQVDYLRGEQRYIFSGDVQLDFADQSLRADRIVYDEETRRADAAGNIAYREPGLLLWADNAYFYFDTNQGALAQTRFQFEHSYAHGDADRVRIEGAEHSEYRNVRFTTCPEDQDEWWLRARRLRVDREQGMATANHARLDFFGVPIFYTPYLTFPIDDRRRSGLLAPTFRHSNRAGLDLRIPYYWNMAPNYDAVLAPRIITRRGVMLDTEWRLLTRHFQAETQIQYLPDDELYGGSRWGASLQAEGPEQGRVQWLVDINRVSDDDYLDDFGGTLYSSSADHLINQALVSYANADWRLSAHALSWQTVDPEIPPSRAPYRTLPRVRLERSPAPLAFGLDYGLSSELTYFDHPSPERRPTGTRLDIMPTVSLPIEHLAYFITPSAALRYTEYWIEAPPTGTRENLSRTLPIFSLDGGVFLERPFQLGERAFLQTLEPRLMYLYIPARDQSELPRFDTSVAELTLGQLFQTNRYTGADRVGDTNQISAAITTRLVDQNSGVEHMSFAVGQIFYLEKREVVVSPRLENPERRRSDVMAELSARLGRHLTGFAEYQWDPYDSRTRKSGVRLRYQPRPDAVVNAAYHLRTFGNEREVEQADFSFVWPLGYRWHAIGGWRYSILDAATVDRFAGFEFDNCCWAFRFLAREHVRDLDREPERSIMFQLEFIGLGEVFDAVQDFVIDAIPGYTPRR